MNEPNRYNNVFPQYEITANNLKQKKFLHLNLSWYLHVTMEIPRDFLHIFGSNERVK